VVSVVVHLALQVVAPVVVLAVEEDNWLMWQYADMPMTLCTLVL
jgi:hypothetical protein